jgi:hypothetical protein
MSASTGFVRGRVKASCEADARTKIRARGFRWPRVWVEGYRPPGAGANVRFIGRGCGTRIAGALQLDSDDGERLAYGLRLWQFRGIGVILLAAGGWMIWFGLREPRVINWGLLVAGAVLGVMGLGIMTVTMTIRVEKSDRAICVRSSVFGLLRFVRKIDCRNVKGILLGLKRFYSSEGDYRAHVISLVMPEGEHLAIYPGTNESNGLAVTRRIAEYLEVPFKLEPDEF